MKAGGHAGRAHARLAASASKQWLNCPPSARLQEELPEEGPSQFAAEGTYCHELTEYKIRTRYLLEELEPPEDSGDWFNEEVDEVTDACATYVIEAAEGYRASGTEPLLLLEERLSLAGYVPESFGTSDVVMFGKGADGKWCLEVMDHKFGRGVFVDVEWNPQLMLYALGALDKYEDFLRVDLVRMTVLQPRLSNMASFELDPWMLRAWGASIVPTALMAFEGRGEQKVGDWCRFCRVRPTCKAQLAEAERVLYEEFAVPGTDPPELVNPGNGAVSVATLAERLPDLERLVGWVESVRACLSNLLLSGYEVPGYKLVEGRSVRKVTDPEALAKALAAHGFEDVWKPRELKGITELEKLTGRKAFNDLFGDFLVKPPGKPTMVPESDRRPAITPGSAAEDDFDDVLNLRGEATDD